MTHILRRLFTNISYLAETTPLMKKKISKPTLELPKHLSSIRFRWMADIKILRNRGEQFR